MQLYFVNILGEKVFISLYGAAVDMNIRLNKNSLILEKTYISLANQQTVTIHNHSNIIAHFQWKIFATQEEEDQEKYRFVRKITIHIIWRNMKHSYENSVAFVVSF